MLIGVSKALGGHPRDSSGTPAWAPYRPHNTKPTIFIEILLKCILITTYMLRRNATPAVE